MTKKPSGWTKPSSHPACCDFGPLGAKAAELFNCARSIWLVPGLAGEGAKPCLQGAAPQPGGLPPGGQSRQAYFDVGLLGAKATELTNCARSIWLVHGLAGEGAKPCSQGATAQPGGLPPGGQSHPAIQRVVTSARSGLKPPSYSTAPDQSGFFFSPPVRLASPVHRALHLSPVVYRQADKTAKLLIGAHKGTGILDRNIVLEFTPSAPITSKGTTRSRPGLPRRRGHTPRPGYPG